MVNYEIRLLYMSRFRMWKTYRISIMMSSNLDTIKINGAMGSV